MDTELLEVLYDYEYDYKEKKISIVCNEKLKLLQRTNQHWWKVVRPGVNKAFFVPAQYVQTISSSSSPVSKVPPSQLQNESTGSEITSVAQEIVQKPDSATNESTSPENSSQNNNHGTGTTTKDHMSNNGVKMKRTDSSRASKRAMKVKNWSASLEELSKQIVFPGLSAESVMNLSTTGVCHRDQPSKNTMGTSKPVPLPRKSSSDAVTVPASVTGMNDGGDVYATPKPIPKARSKTVICDSSNSNKSSGGSSEILTSSEDLLTTGRNRPSSMRKHNYKESSLTPSPQDMKTTAATTTATISPMSNSASTSLTELGKPPPPSKEDKPIRLLLDNWAEFLTSEKRLFYYNDLTGATSWKPPRVNSIRHDSSFEDTAPTTTANSPNSTGNSSFLGHGLKSTAASAGEGENNNVPQTRSSPMPSLSLTEDAQLPVPEGWSCSLDEASGQFCYVNHVSGARWFSSQDPQGKIYYYEENSNKSSWFLPVPGIAVNEEHNSSSPLSKSTTSDSLETRESTPPKVTPDVVNLVKKRHSTGDVADRFLKARSLVILDPNRKSSELVSVKNASLPRSPNSRSIWNPSTGTGYGNEFELFIVKEDVLSRTKITENGKKVRKNWATVYVVLTEEHLSLFKDQKTFTNPASRKAEIEIELVGSSVEWTADKSSRKNVFQLNTCQGLQILFQTDERKLAAEWVAALEEVIGAQTKPDFSLRLCSTSPDTFLDNPIGEKKGGRIGRAKSTKVKITGSVENLSTEEKNKIKAQLKKFFHRRPPRESLVKKGIYKDESVFGCHLEKLCAREDTLVPRFVQECIAAIESKQENLKTDGIYRASGNLSQVQKIRLQVDQNNLACLYQEDDVHVLAGSLKLFFREMKEPLIPCNLFQKALEASNLQNKKDRLACFNDIVSRLEKPNKATLHVLLKHLLKVSEFADFNRMLIPNLAIVFGPTLMWPAQESTNMALDLMQQNLVIEALLLDFNSIFER